MSNTKVCPACQKLLPVLAVRCKFCGFRQPQNRGDAGAEDASQDGSSDADAKDSMSGAEIKKSTLPPARVATDKAKKETSRPNGTASNNARVDKSKTGLGGGLGMGKGKFGDGVKSLSKRTLLGPGALDSATSPRGSLGLKPDSFKKTSKKTSAAAPSPTEKKKPSPLFQGPTTGAPDHPTAAGASGSAAPPSPFAGRPSKAPTRPAMKPVATPSALSSALSAARSNDAEDSDILSLDDDSQLVLLESDQSGTMELDLDNLPADITVGETDEDATKGDAGESSSGNRTKAASTAVMGVVSRMRAGSGALSSLVVRWMGQATASIGTALSRLRDVSVKVWAVMGGVLLVLGIGLVLLMSSGAEEKAESNAAVAKRETPNAVAKPKSVAVKSKKSTAKPSTRQSGIRRHQCRAVSEYGSFMWQQELVSLLEKAGAKGVCDIMDQTFASMTAAFASLNPVMSSGLDGVPGSATLMVVPEGADKAGAGGIIFVFYETKLFRVILDFGAAREIELDMDDFEAAFETEAERSNLGDMSVTGFVDGDVRIELVQHRGDVKRRELQFTVTGLDVGLEKKLTEQRTAERHLAKANGYMLRQQYSNAVDAFQLAADANELCGAAWVGRATAQLYLEDFSGARAAANRALTVVDDDRIHALASHVLAVISLRSGDVKGAIAALEQAVSKDAANGDAALALNELKTGKYSTDRVAMTAARMSCVQELGATLEGLLARGNFPDTQTFFEALKTAKMDIFFERHKREWVSRECR
ncbi:MAG: hypothetical protein JXX14_10020 [Deltaproteobacteria bacterium]|nr:hypothetical protein [Deltaproteobacteria bacterium]